MPTPTIRPVHLTDAAALQRACWSGRTLIGIIEFLQRAEKTRAKRRGLGVVAVLDNHICGFGMLTLWPRTAEISDLIVSSGYQGHGIGTAIITHLTTTARELNAQVLEIGVALSNHRALDLYRHLEFHDHHTLHIDLGDGPEPVLYLEKSLLLR
ncbi:MAG: GNAT family N-acetyltransferase [Anaerolineae bacterium]|nr:GNAT family N-acetyltransferase [Anaerolineae bacterium]